MTHAVAVDKERPRQKKSAGQEGPLPADVRVDMERSFGASFRGAHVHSDRSPSEPAEQHGADAYTTAEHVTFARGAFDPWTTWGRGLIAHELAHVVQQRGGSGGPALGSSPALEAQADQAATAVLQGTPVPALSAAPVGVQKRISMRDVGRGEQSGFARVQELVDRMTAVSTGLTFAIVDGFLTYTEIDGGTLSEFDRQMEGYIDDDADLLMRFTNRTGLVQDVDGFYNDRVLVDQWSSGYVDIDDLLASSDIGLETALVHILRERQRTRLYSHRIGMASVDDQHNPAANREFQIAHASAIAAELPVLRDFFDDPSIRVVDTLSRTYRNDRRDIIRVKVVSTRSGATAGTDAVTYEVVLHDTHKVISAEEYRDRPHPAAANP
jgi:hypothetical protein